MIKKVMDNYIIEKVHFYMDSYFYLFHLSCEINVIEFYKNSVFSD